jgi:CRISPR-associated endonuclease/helicase Cas3
MTLHALEVTMANLLAKSKPPTTLFRHSLDVVKQMAEYYHLYKPVWTVPDDSVSLPRILAYAALVHDFGKVHVDFQKMLKEEGQKFGNRHEILSLCFLDWLNIPDAERAWIEAAVALHHKNLFSLTAAGAMFHCSDSFGGPNTYAGHLADRVSSEASRLLYKMLSHADEILSQAGWQGILCYQLGEYRDLNYASLMKQALIRVDKLARQFEAPTDDFGRVGRIPWELRRGGIQVRGLMLLADHLASAEPHSLNVGLQDSKAVKTAIAKKTGVQELKSHQVKLADQQGSAMLVAPTGSGKTEAALLWSARQAESGCRGRTFVLLPYQTSMNAMQARLIETFEPNLKKHPKLWIEHVALIHGRSVRAAYERLLEKKYEPDEAVRTARIESDLARLDVSPVRVCSPYQILRLLFEPKGVEGLMQSLSQARLIFDEIHAYDPQVTALTLAATQFLTEQLDAKVLFMTATMPAHLADVIQATFGSLPLLRPDEDVMGGAPRHQLNIAPFHALSPEAINWIKNAAKHGSVLVVVNQINRAINLCEALKPDVADLHLLHSRFTNEERFRIEKELKPCPGRILVATQAVEVSLDVSYDTCFSELAPLESLLQRFGRCNRYGKLTGQPASVFVYAQFPPGANAHRPYDEEHLATTLDVLKKCIDERNGILAELDIEGMLNESYPPQLKSKLEQQMSSQLQRIRDSFGRSFMPFGGQDQNHFKALEQQWEELFDGNEVLPESLREKAAAERSWLARARYLVPISGRKFAMLKRQGKIEWCDDLMCHIVYAPYKEQGLQV